MNNSILYKFIYKVLCILKAASDGWIVTYVGGNKFEFSKLAKINRNVSLNNVLKQYTSTLPHILSQRL